MLTRLALQYFSSFSLGFLRCFTASCALAVMTGEPAPLQWAAISVEFAGVAVLALPDGAFSLNAGRCWLLLAALLLSAYNLLQRRLTKTYTALQTTTYSIFAGTLMLAVFLPASVREGSGARRGSSSSIRRS